MWAVMMVVLLVLHSCVPPALGYGEPDANGHPNYQERANHVFLNAVRLSPSQYKTTYMAGYSPSPANILLNYPAVAPVRLEPKLVNSAFAHSSDMATNGCFSHSSCDGTDIWTRIKKYYTCSGTMGENIAAGNADPLDTSNQWLCDSVNGACAADNSANDGHRSNMMGSGYKAVGVGYAYSATATYRHYWTQDFGGASCAPAPTSPVYGGSHRVKSGTTRFIAVYYTSPAAAPASATVVINGVSQNLALDVGAAGAGTYFFSQPAATGCRSYYFQFGTVRYPDTGCLVTYGEGTCTTSFDATCGGTGATTATTAAATTAAATTAAATTAAATTAAATTAGPTSAVSTVAATVAATSTTSKTTTTTTSAKAATTTTSAKAATTTTTGKVATTTTAAATTSASTTGSGTTYYLYQNTLQNGWLLQYNGGVTVSNTITYQSRVGFSATFASSGGSTFIFFNHVPQVTNVWTSLKFYVAASTSSTFLVYFNGGYYQSKAVNTAWQLYTIPLSSIGNPGAGGAPYAALGAPNQLVFQNGGSTAYTFYLSDVALV